LLKPGTKENTQTKSRIHILKVKRLYIEFLFSKISLNTPESKEKLLKQIKNPRLPSEGRL
jgi:hypothetical protein